MTGRNKPVPPGWTRLKGKKGRVDFDIDVNTNNFAVIERNNNNTRIKLRKKGD